MHDAALEPAIGHDIEHAAHLLPSQGPITVFVHHNTLHAFEDRPFDRGVMEGAALYGCHPYRSEAFYRDEAARGRIAAADLAAVLIDDLGDEADRLIGFMGTRYHLRLAMLEHPLRLGTDAELRWLIAETDALRRFRDEAPRDLRRTMIDQTRRWILRDYLNHNRGPARGDGRRAGSGSGAEPGSGMRADGIAALIDAFGGGAGAAALERGSERTWEAFTLHALWRICHAGVHGVPRFGEAGPVALPRRHRDVMRLATGRDTDLVVHDLLIRFCAAFVDQGFAGQPLPGREAGFFRAFAGLQARARPVAAWLRDLPAELRRIESGRMSAIASIADSLRRLGVGESERAAYLSETLLALRGWAGMIWQLETNAEWAARPLPRGTLQDFLAVRLILERLSLRQAAAETLALDVSDSDEDESGGDDRNRRAGTRRAVALRDLRTWLRQRLPHPPRVHVEPRAYLVFQLAQIRGWGPADLQRLSKAEWARLVEEIESFGGLPRRRIYHQAYERHYRNQALDALLAHNQNIRARAKAKMTPGSGRPSFQVVCCLDEREESFRRHLEEAEPTCETFGVAGFFGVAMYYRGVGEAQFRPLCPVNLRPRHYVQEEPIRSFEDASRLQAKARRRLGRVSHRVHVETRTVAGGFLAGLLGSLASVPLLMRVLLPRRTARLRRLVGRMVTPPLTELRLERDPSAEPDPGREPGQWGYTRPEMADIVAGVLGSIGLTERWAPLVLIVGHGSASLNNPHEAAYDCGACGGASGGPNARAFAQMANDPRVRRILFERGLAIPDDVQFLGVFHNTCDDGLVSFDLDRLPASHRAAFERARAALEDARRRNAHERCRRFQSARLDLGPDEALRHVEGRGEDLSQTRPEYGHSTNAVCVVGRRDRTRGLFLDRRAFLASYDPTQDDADGTTLTHLLRAVVPVCAGINLEYYFSSADPVGYGCGTKLPHNITSLLGVMDGPASDLRTGLNWQMVEIHEPMRLLLVVETRPELLAALLDREESLGRLVRNEWVQLATLDPDSDSDSGSGGSESVPIWVYRDGRFEPYEPKTRSIPVVPSSRSWYRGWRDHLGFASIVSDSDLDSDAEPDFAAAAAAGRGNPR
jgi:uncharacterized protein YbcC (UPF0753/DUF2309 family)